MKRNQVRFTLLVCMTTVFGGMIFCVSCSSPKEDPSSETKDTESQGKEDQTASIKPAVTQPRQDDQGTSGDLELETNEQSQPHTPAANKKQVDGTASEAERISTKKVEISDEREPIFEGWSKPSLALFISGRQHGYIEPCGCTGLENQKGGLARRKTLMRQLEEKGWPLVALDVGNQVRRFGIQPVIKYEKTMEGLKAMNYSAIGLGPDDLRLPSIDLLRIILTVFPDAPTPFISANVVIDETVMSPFQILEAAGKRIGVTSVLGKSKQKNLSGTDITLKSPEIGLNAVWPKLKDENCDFYVLLAHASLDETRELARKFPEFDIVVTAGGAGEPTLKPEKIEGAQSQMVQVGTKGMYIGVIGIFEDEDQPIRYQRVPLDDRFGDSKDMLELLRSYQEQLETTGLEGLGLAPQPHPTGRRYVGSEACHQCHEDEYNIWKNGLDDYPGYHAHATASIVKPPNDRSEVPRHHDPECISCHVTGWNPQKYYPYASGYLDLAKSKLLHGSGCENCHGPGSEHIVEESAETIQLSNKEHCLQCHDLDNSPDFKFETYWPRIKH